MSKESFARGFCKVAAEHGVDPVMLAKCAWDEDGVEHDALQKARQAAERRAAQPAGVGTFDQNALVEASPVGKDGWVSAHPNVNSKPLNPNSFFGKLMRNAQFGPEEKVYDGMRGTFAPSETDALNVLAKIAPMKYRGSPDNSQITKGDLDQMRYDQARLAAKHFFPEGSADSAQLRKLLEAWGRENEAEFLQSKEVPYKGLKSVPAGLLKKLSPQQQESLKAFRNSMVRNGTPSAKATKTAEENAAATQMPGGFPPYIKGFADAPKRSAWIMMMKDKIDKAGKKTASLIHVR